MARHHPIAAKAQKKGSGRPGERPDYEPTPQELGEKHTLPPGTTLLEFMRRLVRPVDSEVDRAGN